jgi:hypothetical protein
MDLSPAHLATRVAAQRPAAIEASHSFLEAGSGSVLIAVFAGPKPAPGDPAGSPALATLVINDPAVLDLEVLRIVLPAAPDALILATATAEWARITNRAGSWWADVDVSDQEGSAPIQLQTTALVTGALLRLISGVFQG